MKRAIFLFLATLLSQAVWANCDANDVALAEEQFRGMQQLASGPFPAASRLELWESQLQLAWAQQCAGRMERNSYCSTAEAFYARVRGLITSERAGNGGATGTIQRYLRDKAIYGAPCR